MALPCPITSISQPTNSFLTPSAFYLITAVVLQQLVNINAQLLKLLAEPACHGHPDLHLQQRSEQL